MVGGLTIPGGIAAATVADAAAGDADALARIVGAHHDDMARICYVICGDQDTAQDAVQAAWPIAWRKLGSRRDPERLRPWLMAVAANEARQILRRQRRFQVVEIEVADVGSHHGDPAARDALTDLAQVTSHGDDDTRVGTPTWTPDATRILFTLIPRSASADGDRYAAFIDLDGSDLTVLSGVSAAHPRLRPTP